MIKTRAWIKPDTGEERHYLQNWREAIGLEVDWYNTGNIKSACLDGQWISLDEVKQRILRYVQEHGGLDFMVGQ